MFLNSPCALQLQRPNSHAMKMQKAQASQECCFRFGYQRPIKLVEGAVAQAGMAGSDEGCRRDLSNSVRAKSVGYLLLITVCRSSHGEQSPRS